MNFGNLSRSQLTHTPCKFLVSPSRKNFSWTATTSNNADHRASSKLFADAEREEAEAPGRKSQHITSREHQNWTGDESIEDAVLRMLVDKYKPLRGGTIRTAEQKLRQAPPQLSQPHSSPIASDPPATFSPYPEPTPSTQPVTPRGDEPILPAIPGHRPWHTTFKVPSHASSSIRYGQIPASSLGAKTKPAEASDDRARKKERETKKRTQVAVRLSRARESTLDYRLGIKSSQAHARPNPSTVKGWQSLVEERIERARTAGHFNTLKGRGQPIDRTVEESNPFIGREEYLLNRIVQRQGAAPPWVELQAELESAVAAFREILRQSWTRRALRTLTMAQPLALLPAYTLADVMRLRDAEWEARERAYHESAIEELNSLVRKHNAMAPYAVRRPYYTRTVELEKAYQDSGEDILQGLAERVRDQQRMRGGGTGFDDADMQGGSTADAGPVLRIRDAIRGWFRWRG